MLRVLILVIITLTILIIFTVTLMAIAIVVVALIIARHDGGGIKLKFRLTVYVVRSLVSVSL